MDDSLSFRGIGFLGTLEESVIYINGWDRDTRLSLAGDSFDFEEPKNCVTLLKTHKNTFLHFFTAKINATIAINSADGNDLPEINF